MPPLRLITVAMLAAAIVSWRFPLVHFSRLDARTKETSDAKFDAVRYADDFWANKLAPALQTARDAGETLAAIHNDPNAACRERGRTIGLSRSCLYLVQGRGVVQSVDRNIVVIALDGDAPAIVALNVGLVFGNMVYDVTGAADDAKPIDSRQLNQISTELNRLVETRVIAANKARMTAGATLRFAGCAQVQGALPDGQPWKLTPLQIEVE